MPRSLKTRLLVVAGVVLALFLGTAGWVLDHGFSQTALASVQERLKGQIFMLLGLADLDQPKQPLANVEIPDLALNTPESGHYVQLYNADGDVVWRSRSMLGMTIKRPTEHQAGDFSFDEGIASTDEKLFCLSYRVQWEATGKPKPSVYIFQACEGRNAYLDQIQNFRRSMSLWLGGLAVFLLLIQTLILRWGIEPLRQVAGEVNAIESGRQTALTGNYPSELRPLTRNLNALIAARDTNLTRYRNALGDLAHSLKTPLAVIRSTLESDPRAAAVADVLRDPVEQLDSTIKYQLQRAAMAGRSTFARPISVAPIVQRIMNSLRKVYHARDLEISSDAPETAEFYGDQGDLMEIIGNLADNACKWARRKIHVEVLVDPDGTRTERPPMLIKIYDDGPGLPPDKVHEVMQRGARLDQSVEGHGIGLATVREIVETGYNGQLSLSCDTTGTTAAALLRFD